MALVTIERNTHSRGFCHDHYDGPQYNGALRSALKFKKTTDYRMRASASQIHCQIDAQWASFLIGPPRCHRRARGVNNGWLMHGSALVVPNPFDIRSGTPATKSGVTLPVSNGRVSHDEDDCQCR